MKLIDKDALLAEIERRLEEYRTYPDYQIDSNYMELCDILSFINTLEVKEVDLEKEISRVSKNEYFDFTDWKSIARHFFELRINAQKGE